MMFERKLPKKCYLLHDADRNLIATSSSKHRIKKAKELYDPVIPVKIKVVKAKDFPEEEIRAIMNSPRDLVSIGDANGGELYIPLDEEDEFIMHMRQFETDFIDDTMTFLYVMDTMNFTPDELYYINTLDTMVTGVVDSLAKEDYYVTDPHDVGSIEIDVVAVFHNMITNRLLEEEYGREDEQ